MTPAPLIAVQVQVGQDSHSLNIVTALPQVMWIDASTLGIFAYYRAAAAGGDLTKKLDSDISQPTAEFLYNQSTLFTSVPARRRFADHARVRGDRVIPYGYRSRVRRRLPGG